MTRPVSRKKVRVSHFAKGTSVCPTATSASVPAVGSEGQATRKDERCDQRFVDLGGVSSDPNDLRNVHRSSLFQKEKDNLLCVSPDATNG